MNCGGVLFTTKPKRLPLSVPLSLSGSGSENGLNGNASFADGSEKATAGVSGDMTLPQKGETRLCLCVFYETASHNLGPCQKVDFLTLLLLLAILAHSRNDFKPIL